MVTEIRIYFEGDSSLKPGFHRFFKDLLDTARNKKIRLSLIATGAKPIQDFKIAVRSHPDAWNIVLLDSDRPDDSRLFEECAAPHGIEEARRDSVFWMVQVMETWFIADREALRRYYGKDFQDSAISLNQRVEQIAKSEIYSGLKRATQRTTKGAYHKTHHAPELLAIIDANKVREVAPQCERFFSTVLARL